MPFLAMMSRRLYRRRVEADLNWREAQDAEYVAAVARLLRAIRGADGRRDAVEATEDEDERFDAAGVRRDEQLHPVRPTARRHRHIWIDSGSGPGFEAGAPDD